MIQFAHSTLRVVVLSGPAGFARVRLVFQTILRPITSFKLAGRQFTLRNLFLGTLAIAGLLGFLAKEPINVGLAAAFCVASWIGILVLSYLTINNLIQLVRHSIRTKQFRGLTGRYRWFCVDGLIVAWLFFTIVTSNFVIANSVANARYLIFTGWAATLMGIIAIVVRITWNAVEPNSRLTKSPFGAGPENQPRDAVRDPAQPGG